jgi:hypothetical protein
MSKYTLPLLLVFLSNFIARGQTLTGTITDETGQPVPNARITLFNADTTLFREVRTNVDGTYLIGGLPDGGPYLFFGAAAPGMEYFENATTGILDTTVHNAMLLPETHPGQWDIIMQSPEPLGGTDLGILMPDGSIYYCHNTKDPFFFIPEENDTTAALGHTQVQGCVAPALLEDGKVLFAGGTLQEIYGPGTNKIKTFDPATGQWLWQPNMLDYRWYPSLSPLYDGKAIIVGGGGLNNPIRVKTSEVYDPETGTTVAADTVHFGNEVSPILPLYNGKILMTHRPPQLFDPETLQWELAADFAQSNRLPNGDHSDHELVHLPDGKVLAVGYKSFTPGQPGVILEMYDPNADEWSLRSNFSPTRSRAKALLLPDKKVLVMGGQKEDAADPTPVNNWGYMNLTDQYDPASDNWKRLQQMNIKREYHAITMLVPDGRIIAVGGEGAPGNEPPQSTIEAFSPPYLFRGIRPEISNLNKTVFKRGESIEFDVAKTNALTSVILMSNAVLTHFMNSGNNRFLELDFAQTGNAVSAALPTDSLHLMPGWYMLFGMVDDIPSVGKMIKIEKGLTPVSGIEQPNRDSFSATVFPNPAGRQFFIKIQNPAGYNFFRIELFSQSGQVVFEDLFENPGLHFEKGIRLPEALPAGVYNLKITSKNAMLTRKLSLH